MSRRNRYLSGLLFLTALCLAGCISNCEIHEQRARLALDSLQYEDALAEALEFYRCADGDSAAKALRLEVERAVQFNDHLQAAREFRDSSDVDRELQELSLALEIDTTEYLLSRLSEVQEDLELWEDAIESCSASIEKGFSLFDNYERMAMLYFEWDNSDKTVGSIGVNDFRNNELRFLNKALELKPSDYSIRRRKQRVTYNLGQIEKSLELGYDLFKEYPDSIQLMINIGYALYGLHDYKGLEDNMYSFISLVDDSLELAYGYRLLAYAEEGRGSSWRTVDLAFQKSLELAPKREERFYLTGLLLKGEALDQRGQYALACKEYREAAELGATGVFSRIREICQ